MATALDKVIPILTEPLVKVGLYPTQEAALKSIVLQYVQQQIKEAQQEIALFERKYGCSFEELTASLKGRATIEEEDDWMAWESARDMLESWQQVQKELALVHV